MEADGWTAVWRDAVAQAEYARMPAVVVRLELSGAMACIDSPVVREHYGRLIARTADPRL